MTPAMQIGTGMGKTQDILARVQNGELAIADAETMLRDQIIDELDQELKFARFKIEIFSEANAPDGVSDFFQPALLYSNVKLRRDSNGKWCDEEGNAISRDLVWVKSKSIGARVANWSIIKRDSVFGMKHEDVFLMVNVEASATEISD